MLKILADECIHQDLIEALEKTGFDILTVDKANLKGVSDDFIFDFAVKNKRILLTFDREFGDFFRFNIRNSAGVVIVLISRMQKREIIRNTITFFKNIYKDDLERKLVIIGRTRVRIRSF
ncbi:DUF5615 family PIN-like protein [Patescibacteria group bacterium]|nr:DUF5615 family PIN-like protein [Patescibacteria group bacterium]